MSYPYVVTVDAFKDFLKRLGGTGVPQKVDQKFLETLGLTSSNHRKFPSVLKFVGLVDTRFAPTPDYEKVFRHGKVGRHRMAELLVEHYSALFGIFPDANQRDREALDGFFKAQTTVSPRAVQAMSATFLALCTLADFEGSEVGDGSGLSLAPSQPPSVDPAILQSGEAGGSVIVNVNIQLEIPADVSVYDALFKSMAEHILRLRNAE